MAHVRAKARNAVLTGKQLRRGEKTLLKGPNLPALEVDAEEWYSIVETVRNLTNEHVPEWACLLQYSVDPMSVVTPDVLDMWNCYQACGGLSRLQSPAEYYDLPAQYVEVVRIIEEKLAELEAVRDGDAQ